MEIVLNTLLPQIIPTGVNYKTIPHDGKSDLRKSIPHKLAGWNIPESKFIIIQDKDGNNCLELKHELVSICEGYGK